MTDYILTQLSKIAYVMLEDGWSSREVAPVALMEIVALRQKIERLEKALETAREDAIEEAAKVAKAKWLEYQGPFGSQAASSCAHEIEAAIRAISKRTMADVLREQAERPVLCPVRTLSQKKEG